MTKLNDQCEQEDPYAGMEDPKIVRAWIEDIDRRQARIMAQLEEIIHRLEDCERKCEIKEG